MNRAAALFCIVAVCGAAGGVTAFRGHNGSGLSPATLQRTMRSSTLESPADLVLTNGRIYTGDAKLPWASAVVIRGETIVAVAATDADLKSFIGPKTRVIDLRGVGRDSGISAHMATRGAAWVIDQALQVVAHADGDTTGGGRPCRA